MKWIVLLILAGLVDSDEGFIVAFLLLIAILVITFN